jgi:hypothetical protein
MKGFLGLELPTTATEIPNYALYPYTSPPVEIINDSKVIGEPLAEMSDGTQIWKVTHNGMDTHPIHVHLFNAQMINRLTMDGKILPPDANELGWKETFRMNPMEAAIVALRPTAPKNQPFEVPNSERLIDPSMPDGVELAGPPGGFKDPQGNPVTVINHKVNYGWEYVYHCHILAHEENDMMHATILAVAPRPPTHLRAIPQESNVKLFWKDNSITETGFTIQRADCPDFTKGLTTFKVGPNVEKYTDTTIKKYQRYYYRVQANNVVGDTSVYPAPSVGFPTTSADSAFSNIAPYPFNAPMTKPTDPSRVTAVAAKHGNSAWVMLKWKDTSNNEDGFRVQYALDSEFTNPVTSTVRANTPVFTTGNVKSGSSYYFRVQAYNNVGESAWVNASPYPIKIP